MNVDKTIALVTGSASGLGEAAAAALLARGARVAGLDAAYRSRTLDDSGLLAIPADVSSCEGVENALNDVRETFGTAPAIVVQCAGCALSGRRVAGPKGTLPRAEFDRVLAVNVAGVFNVMSQAANAMLDLDVAPDSERGVIVNVSSINADDGPVGTLPYSCSKAAVQGMTLPAARDLGPFGIRVNCIAPGSFDTPMLRAMPPEAVEAITAANPWPKRPAKPEEFAALVIHMVENQAINGANWRIDCAARLAITG